MQVDLLFKKHLDNGRHGEKYRKKVKVESFEKAVIWLLVKRVNKSNNCWLVRWST